MLELFLNLKKTYQQIKKKGTHLMLSTLNLKVMVIFTKLITSWLSKCNLSRFNIFHRYFRRF